MNCLYFLLQLLTPTGINLQAKAIGVFKKRDEDKLSLHTAKDSSIVCGDCFFRQSENSNYNIPEKHHWHMISLYNRTRLKVISELTQMSKPVKLKLISENDLVGVNDGAQWKNISHSEIVILKSLQSLVRIVHSLSKWLGLRGKKNTFKKNEKKKDLTEQADVELPLLSNFRILINLDIFSFYLLLVRIDAANNWLLMKFILTFEKNLWKDSFRRVKCRRWN